MTRTIVTPLGNMVARTDGTFILSLDFADEKPLQAGAEHPLLLRLEKELCEYFSGERTLFTLPLNPHGTEFQTDVWKVLTSIPYGQTLSYAQEAQYVGNPKAVRAVAGANARNPIAILIPCHRVIASDGTPGGYRAGVWRKAFLLRLESTSVG